MKKENIVKEKKDFNNAFNNNVQYKSNYSYVYINDNMINKYRFGICISKKIGNAVKRNKLKRRIKDIIDKSSLQFLHKDYIIVLKVSAKQATYFDLKNDILNILTKIIEKEKTR